MGRATGVVRAHAAAALGGLALVLLSAPARAGDFPYAWSQQPLLLPSGAISGGVLVGGRYVQAPGGVSAIEPDGALAFRIGVTDRLQYGFPLIMSYRLADDAALFGGLTDLNASGSTYAVTAALGVEVRYLSSEDSALRARLGVGMPVSYALIRTPGAAPTSYALVESAMVGFTRDLSASVSIFLPISYTQPGLAFGTIELGSSSMPMLGVHVARWLDLTASASVRVGNAAPSVFAGAGALFYFNVDRS